MVEGDRVIGHIGIRNSGRLPAGQLSWFIDIKDSHKGNEEIFAVGDAKGRIIVTPGARARRGSDKHVFLQKLLSASGADSGVERNRENPLYLYVWGVVYYKDGIR
jgi:hypothetical protein